MIMTVTLLSKNCERTQHWELMAEGNIQEHQDWRGSDDPQSGNFNVDGWASFNEVCEKEQVKRVKALKLIFLCWKCKKLLLSILRNVELYRILSEKWFCWLLHFRVLLTCMHAMHFSLNRCNKQLTCMLAMHFSLNRCNKQLLCTHAVLLC